jgi:protein TonB
MYPPIAKAARVSGTVVLHAVISTTGSVIELHVVSGPAMLQQSAIDAVKQWKYRPFLLNNQPVEVETTISVIYTLGD